MVRVSLRANGSLLSCDIWLLTTRAVPSLHKQANHVRGWEKKEWKTRKGRATSETLRQDKQQLANYINL